MSLKDLSVWEPELVEVVKTNQELVGVVKTNQELVGVVKTNQEPVVGVVKTIFGAVKCSQDYLQMEPVGVVKTNFNSGSCRQS